MHWGRLWAGSHSIENGPFHITSNLGFSFQSFLHGRFCFIVLGTNIFHRDRQNHWSGILTHDHCVTHWATWPRKYQPGLHNCLNQGVWRLTWFWPGATFGATLNCCRNCWAFQSIVFEQNQNHLLYIASHIEQPEIDEFCIWFQFKSSQVDFLKLWSQYGRINQNSPPLSLPIPWPVQCMFQQTLHALL